ncbi:MAG: adenosine deaminase family protein [Asticcacaulis sp.]
MAYFARAAADHVRHAEIFFDPQTHTDRGIAFETVINGLHAARNAAFAKYGLTSGLILCFLRHLDEDAAFTTLTQAEPYLDRIIGRRPRFLGSRSPAGQVRPRLRPRPRLWSEAGRHAGEEGPPDYVYEALDILHIDRIDHGNRSLEDAGLTKRIAAEGLTLTVCPLSNHKLCVVKDLKDHPIPDMLKKGLRATLNSDDPAYFGGYVNDNFRSLTSRGLIDRGDCLILARNSIAGSFASEDRKAQLMAEIEAYAAVH